MHWVGETHFNEFPAIIVVVVVVVVVVIIIIIISFFKVDVYITFYNYKKPINICLFKLINRNFIKRCEICSKLTKKHQNAERH